MSSEYKALDETKLIEDYEESLIRLAMANYAEIDGQKILRENDELKDSSFYQPSEEAKCRFIKTMNHYYHKQKINAIFRSSYRYLNKIAALLLLIFVVLSISICSVEAIRIKVLNLIINMQAEYTEIRLDNGKDNKNIIGNNLYINWDNAYAPTYIPDGYSIRNLTNNKNMKVIEYSNENGGIIFFQQLDEKSSANIDTEDADKIEKIMVQGNEGLLINKNGLISVIWNKDSFIFMLNAQTDHLQKEDVVKIAESVLFIK